MKNSIYIIAEIGNSHEGSVGLAKKFIETVKECGANAVKLQTHLFEYESVKDAPSPYYFRDESRETYFNRTSFNLSQWKELRDYSKSLGLDFISSPFSIQALDLLEKVEIDAYKIASGEITNLPLIEKISLTGKKIFISSGMSTTSEIEMAVSILEKNKSNFVLMQCTSIYPCPAEKSGLNILGEWINKYGQNRVGYSDHTEEIGIPLAAVSLGAMYLEKHFTLSKKMYGSDAKFSLEPIEFSHMVYQIREIEKALNNTVDKDQMANELSDMKKTFEKSLVYLKKLNAGHKILDEDIGFKKPGTGIPPKDLKKIIGEVLTKKVNVDQQINYNDFE